MRITKSFSEVNVLVVGDVMLDRYWWGSVNRISPEAPVPIVNLEKTSLVVGGAANVAANVAGLGANAFLIGVIGEDEEGDLLTQVLIDKNISTDFLIKIPNRPTTVKTRIVAHSQQIVRIDQETKKKISPDQENRLWKKVDKLLSKIKIIVISDYGKGTLADDFVMRLITAAKRKDISILIDPKGKDYQKYRGATMLTPNRFEVGEVCHLEDFEQETIESAGEKMLSELSLESLLITQGEAGMTLFEKNKEAIHLSVTARKVYDVTGAGDTVIASLAVAVGGGFSFLEAAEFANQAAGLVVEQIGTTAVSPAMFNDADSNHSESSL